MNRNLLILGTLLLLLMGVWVFSLCSGLFQAYQQDKLLSTQLNRLENASSILAQQQVQIHRINELEQGLRSRRINMDQPSVFLKYVDSLAQTLSLNILDFPHEKKVSIQSYEIIESKIKLEGNYKSLIKFIHQIELLDRVGVITQLDLQREDMRVEGKSQSYLITDLTLQRLSVSP